MNMYILKYIVYPDDNGFLYIDIYKLYRNEDFIV